MSSKNLKTRKLFELNTLRVKEVFKILEQLSYDWLLNFKNASKFWVTNDEWMKTQHYFLWASSKNKEKIEQLLDNKTLF